MRSSIQPLTQRAGWEGPRRPPQAKAVSLGKDGDDLVLRGPRRDPQV